MFVFVLLSLLLTDDPKPFESKKEKDAAIAAVRDSMAPIEKSIALTKEDLEAAKKARVGKGNSTRMLADGRRQHTGFNDAKRKADTIAAYEKKISDLQGSLKPYEEQIAAIKKRPVVPPKPAEKKDG